MSYIRGPMKKGVFKKYTPDRFVREFGYDSSLWIDKMGLEGDAADNIPGVRNIGPKRAQALVSMYGRIENIFANAHNVPVGAGV